MTLIVGGANTEFVFLVSDRRFSYGGGYFEDERNKAIFFALKDARLLVAFTGLAEQGNFRTAAWITTALSESARPKFLLAPCIERFTEAATARFQTLPCSLEMRRLSIVMVGYLAAKDSPLWCWIRVSNFERGGKELPQAEVFKFESMGEVRPCLREPHFAFAAGMKRALSRDRLNELAQMMSLRKPPAAAVDKAVDMINTASSSSLSGGTIGTQCNSVYLCRHDMAARAAYHSATATNETYLPDSVIADGRMGIIGRGIKIEAFDSTGNPRPLTIPKVRMDAPCPCGSGRRYKHCHGARGSEKI
jgi:hypothetical protein